MSKKRPCPLCRQLHDPKRATLALPTLKEKMRPKLPGDYHCPRCGQWDERRLRHDVWALRAGGLSPAMIAKRLGLTPRQLAQLCPPS